MEPELPARIVLYDGVCGLCNRLNRFVLKRDRRDRFRFVDLDVPLYRMNETFTHIAGRDRLSGDLAQSDVAIDAPAAVASE
jgi:predicted DCC family thiol-disulfide oxidoreductase YuxK